MKLIKITTKDKEPIKEYVTDIMSYDEGIIEIVVGWDLAKEMGASILNHKINDTKYWTFSPQEKRKVFEEHIKSFLEESLQNLINKIKIKNLNPLDFKNEDDYINHIQKNVRGCDGYLYSNKLYVYCGKEIYHIDKELLSFMSWDVIDRIKSLLIIKEYDEIPKEIGHIDIKYIPYLNAKEDNISSNIC
jgi:hypothetical protein